MKLAHVMLLAAVVALGQQAPANKTLKVTISSKTPTVEVGAPLEVEVTLTNISDKEVNISDFISGITGQYNNYLTVVLDEKGNKAPKRKYEHEELDSGHVILRSLEPQESETDRIDLSRRYSFSPGKYSIQVVRFVSPESGGVYAVSNPLTVEVTPKQPSIQ
jgi:hypothetical protein